MKPAWLLILGALGCGSSSTGDDGPDGECPDFTRIAGGTFARTPATLTWTLEVEGLPTALTFDRTGLPSFALEYSWGIEIDSNVDGETDWEVSAKHFRTAGPERIGDALSNTQQDLWRIDGPAGTIAGSVDASVSGATFTFTVEASEDPDLANVTDASQSAWTTFHQFGPALGDRCEDRFTN
jgi:hypothetical protein